MRKVAIRIDDICENMDFGRLERFEAILNKYNIKPLIGVVPCNKDSHLVAGEKKENYETWLKDKIADGYTIALHGCYHEYVTKKGGIFPLNDYSEFAGLSEAKQAEKLDAAIEGLNKLGITSNIFMAPAHSFDNNTIKLLNDRGYKYITDGFGKMPYKYRGMTFLPIAMLKNKDVRKKDGYTTIVIHVGTMQDKDFEYFERFLESIKEQLINYSELLNVKAVKRGFIGHMVEYMEAKAKHLIGKKRK